MVWRERTVERILKLGSIHGSAWAHVRAPTKSRIEGTLASRSCVAARTYKLLKLAQSHMRAHD